MDVQAYRVAVRLALDDQITRNMMRVSEDAMKLNEKFIQMQKNIKAITSAAKEATKAISGMNSAMKNQFANATQGANNYASAMRNAANNARDVAKANQEASRSTGGLLPYIAGGAMLGSGMNGQYIPRGNSGPSGNLGYNGRTFDGEVVRGSLPAPSPLMLGYAGGGRGGNGGGGVGIGAFGGGPLSQGGYGGTLVDSGIRRWRNGVPPGGWGGGGTPGGVGGESDPARKRSTHTDGMTNLATGYLGFELLDGIVKSGAEYQAYTEKFNQFGMGSAALAEAEKFADASKVFGASSTDMMRYMVEAQGVFRDSGLKTINERLSAAKMAAPVLAKWEFATRTLDPKMGDITASKEMDALRFAEMMGGLQSPEKFNEIMNWSFKAIQSSGGNIDFTQLRQFAAKAGTSALRLSNRALYSELEPIIGELKGGGAGDALMTSYNRVNGIVKLPNQVAHELVRMGVWNNKLIEWNSQGGIKRFKGNPLVNSGMFATDPIQYYNQVIRPSYQKAGMNEEQIQRENALIFGRTGGKMFNIIEKIISNNPHFFDNSNAALNQSRDMNGASEAGKATYNGQLVNFEKKWVDLEVALARDGGLLDTFTKGLKYSSDMMEKMTKLSHEYPQVTRFVTNAALAITGLAGLSGGIWVLSHAAGALFTPLKLVGWAVNSLLGIGATSGSIPMLATALGGLPAVISGILVAVTAFSAYEVYKWYKEGKTDDNFKAAVNGGSKGAFEYNGRDPTALARYKHQINPKDYPAVPPPFDPRSTTPVNLTMTHQGRQVLIATLSDALTKEATKPRTSVSGFDPSHLMVPPGSTSGLVTK